MERPVPREGRSPAGMPPPNFDGPYEEDIGLGYASGSGCAAGRVEAVSSQIGQGSSITTSETSSDQTLTPSCDKGTDAEGDVEEAEQGHPGLLEDGNWMREDGAATQTNDVDIGGDSCEEPDKSNGDGNMHPEHALLGVFGVGLAAEED